MSTKVLRGNDLDILLEEIMSEFRSGKDIASKASTLSNIELQKEIDDRLYLLESDEIDDKETIKQEARVYSILLLRRGK